MARLAPLFVLAVALLLALACRGEGDEQDGNPFRGSTPLAASPAAALTSPSSPDPSPTPAPAPPVASSSGPPPGAAQTSLPLVGLELVFDDARFERMTGLYEGAGGSWYVTEQPGRVRRIDSVTGQSSLWLDLTDRVDASGSEIGLLGFALPPEFETSRVFYVSYTGGGQSIVSRFGLSANDGADAATEQRLFAVDQPFRNHNAGQIAFGPDGYLYLSLGDGGGGSDPNGNGQDPGTLLGSVLRLDVSGGGDTYAVPADNPFVAQGGGSEEVWAYGFRNPWRFSFDRLTGDLWLGDVGGSSREEIDLVVPGGNYGWRVMEGFECRGGGSACDSEGLQPPVFDYATGSGGTCSVTGGFVYRGSAIPTLEGAYVFSDYCSGAIYALRAPDGVIVEQAEIASAGLRVSSMAEGRDGELYVLEHGSAGGIYKLVP